MMDQTPTLHLLKAEDLPTSLDCIRKHATVESGRALTPLLTMPAGADDEATLGRVEYALTQLGPPGQRVYYTAEDIARLPDDRYEEHDIYFGAVRVNGSPTEMFTRTLLEAYRGHLRDAMGARVAFVAEQRGWLADAFTASFALLRRCQPDNISDGPTVSVAPVAVAPVELDPHLRWKLGHQVFFALMQALIVTMGCAEDALLRRDSHASAFIDTATLLMRGSAAALRYAGDFSPAGYAQVVRPSMMPPTVEPKFSGLQLRDHRYLIKSVKSLRAVVRSADGAIQKSYQLYVEAMAETYDEHKLVCERFGGLTEPSLRMNAGASMSAADALERLKHGRLRTANR